MGLSSGCSAVSFDCKCGGAVGLQRAVGIWQWQSHIRRAMLEDLVPPCSTSIAMASPTPTPASSPAFCILLFTLLVARAATRDADSVPSDSSGRRHAAGTTSVSDATEEEGRESSNPTVILDSGASYHATADRWCLSGFDAAAPVGRDAVHRTRDGTELPAAGAGTLASEKFQLPDVLHIPGLMSRTVLVSVQLLARWGYLVMFGAGQCLVMDRSAGKLVGQGRLQEDDGLYRLDFLKIPLDAAAAAAEGTDSNVV